MNNKKSCPCFILVICIISLTVNAEGLPWYLKKPSIDPPSSAINAERLILNSISSDVVVAVIDNGIYSEHPSLGGKLLVGVDMVSASYNPRGGRSENYAPDSKDSVCPLTGKKNLNQAFYHGTEVASVIAGNGELGVYGVNPKAKILPIKVLGACTASRIDLIDAIYWASGFHVEGVKDNQYPVRVINISMSGQSQECDPALQQALNMAYSKGILVVSAAGNTFRKAATEPSVCSGVISVGAVNYDKSLTFFSADDDRIVIFAPGGGKDYLLDGLKVKDRIRVATYEDNFFGTDKLAVGADIGIGTSFSAPLVSGVISGLVQISKDTSPQNIMSKIKSAQFSQSAKVRHYLDFESLSQ